MIMCISALKCKVVFHQAILDYDVVMNFDCQCGAKDIYQIVEDLERTFKELLNDHHGRRFRALMNLLDFSTNCFTGITAMELTDQYVLNTTKHQRF